jgi:hypothetical protein
MTTMIKERNEYIKWSTIQEINRTLFKIEQGEKIEDLEIGEEPNTLICFSGRNKVEINYNNIYGSVRNIITDRETIIKKYREVPEYIENIVVEHRIYKNTKSRIEFIELMEEKEIRKVVKELIEEKNINIKNSFNENLLMICIKYKIKEYIDYLYENMDEEIRDITTKHKRNILYWACYGRMAELGKKIVKKANKEMINMVDIFNLTALDWSCSIGERELSYEIVRRMDGEIIKKITEEGKKRIIIDETCLYYAKLFKMEEVIEEIEKKIKE